MAVAISLKTWTLEELHSLPDDGNKYELIWGELYVTPPPTDPHETIAARLTRILDPFVAKHRLGFVYHPRAVFRYKGSEVEPDLMVRQRQTDPKADWDKAPTPILIVEIFSPTTRRRDQERKREFYLDSGINEYWMIDPDRRMVTVVRRDEPDITSAVVIWTPPGASASLMVNVHEIFD